MTKYNPERIKRQNFFFFEVKQLSSPRPKTDFAVLNEKKIKGKEKKIPNLYFGPRSGKVSGLVPFFFFPPPPPSDNFFLRAATASLVPSRPKMPGEAATRIFALLYID